jgi:hypothetical protein
MNANKGQDGDRRRETRRGGKPHGDSGVMSDPDGPRRGDVLKEDRPGPEEDRIPTDVLDPEGE